MKKVLVQLELVCGSQCTQNNNVRVHTYIAELQHKTNGAVMEKIYHKSGKSSCRKVLSLKILM